jgi:predicted transcriptional regulator
MAQRVLEYVSQNPGQGVEHIASAFSMETRELVLPIKKLLSSNELRTEGQRRATRYFPRRGR